MSKDMKERDFQEYLEEKRIRKDLENLTVEDFIGALASTIDINTTVDMILHNLEEALFILEHYKINRIRQILFMKLPCELKERKNNIVRRLKHG